MKQQTTNWLEWRMGGIGSSDAPAVVNESKWSDPQTLWELLTNRRDFPEATYPMRRGLAVEPVARRLHEERTEVSVSPDTAIHAKYDFIRASLDGVNYEEERLTELKAPGIKDHVTALIGQVPRHYIPQLVHQMAVMNAPSMIYHSFYSWKVLPKGIDPLKLDRRVMGTFERIQKEQVWRPAYIAELRENGGTITDHLPLGENNCVDLLVHRNKPLEDYLLEAEIKFWEYVQRDVPPPKDFMKRKKPELRLVTELMKPSELFKVRAANPKKEYRRATAEEIAQGKQRAQERRDRFREETVTRPVIGKAISDRVTGSRYSAEEVIEILRLAKELGLSELRSDGLEFRAKR